MKKWKVVPICEYQNLDVRPEDLLDGGDYRKCDTYRGGGGYDRFPHLALKFGITQPCRHQFVVQLYGCNLDCPYCYVTRSGVWGKYKEVSTEELLDAFKRSGCEVFHLMGGAPAIYLNDWVDILSKKPDEMVFHSDFLLTEHKYGAFALASISWPNCLYAVDIKGVTPENYTENTRKPYNPFLLWGNLSNLILHSVPFYLTFTNPDKDKLEEWWARYEVEFGKAETKKRREDAFVIDLVEYDAAPFVDIRPIEVTK